jgi:hypothetical protein
MPETELYVPTDGGGKDEGLEEPVKWPLPGGDAAAPEPGEPAEGALALYQPAALLGRLNSRIWVGEVLDSAGADAPEQGVVHAAQARLLAPAAWDGFAAAGFAIDCAFHVLGAAGDVELPDGTPLGEALQRVRDWLSTAEADAGALHRVRDLALVWRLRRQGKSIGDAAFEAFIADRAADVGALDDPVWAATAAARDAALAAVEAVQHAVFPHVTALEGSGYRATERHVDMPPMGHEHAPSSWVPYWVATDDAAERARSAGGDDELEWQADRLGEVLRGAGGAGA